MATCNCQNCDWQGDEDDTKPIENIFQRVAAGEIMPAGECPICGSLCQLSKEPEERVSILHGTDGKWHLFDNVLQEAMNIPPFRRKKDAEQARTDILAEWQLQDEHVDAMSALAFFGTTA